MKEKLFKLKKLIKSMPIFIRNWYNCSTNGRANHIIILSGAHINLKQNEFVKKKQAELLQYLDKLTIKKYPQSKPKNGTKIIYKYL